MGLASHFSDTYMISIGVQPYLKQSTPIFFIISRNPWLFSTFPNALYITRKSTGNIGEITLHTAIQNKKIVFW